MVLVCEASLGRLLQFIRVLGGKRMLVCVSYTLRHGEEWLVRQLSVIDTSHCVDRCIREVREAFNNFKEVAKTCHSAPVLKGW